MGKAEPQGGEGWGVGDVKMTSEVNSMLSLPLLCVCLLASSCASSRLAPREYVLLRLMISEQKQPAPATIVATVVALEKAGLEDDKCQQLRVDEAELLAVLPLHLDSDGIQDFLVYPTHHLPTFCGAHSIACWVFKGDKNGNHRLVLSGRHDAVRVLETETKGMRDIDLVYWTAVEEVSKFTFNGQEYERSEEAGSAVRSAP